MSKALLRMIAGIGAILSGIFINIIAIVPHYTTLAYDKRVISGMDPGINPGGPALLGIPSVIIYW